MSAEQQPAKKKKSKKIREWVVIKIERVRDKSARSWHYPRLRGLFVGRIRRNKKGRYTGLSFCEYTAIMLDANETLKKAKKLTDESILQAIIKEFKGISKTVDDLASRRRTIGYLRAKFNRGKLTGSVPVRQSHRFDENGDIIPGHNRKSKAQSADVASVNAVQTGLKTAEIPSGVERVDAAGENIL